jgi:hypothetical protein
MTEKHEGDLEFTHISLLFILIRAYFPAFAHDIAFAKLTILYPALFIETAIT